MDRTIPLLPLAVKAFLPASVLIFPSIRLVAVVFTGMWAVRITW